MIDKIERDYWSNDTNITIQNIIKYYNLNKEYTEKFMHIYRRDGKVTPDIIARAINMTRFGEKGEYREKYEKIEDLLVYCCARGLD